jgi:hypothetical protein
MPPCRLSTERCSRAALQSGGVTTSVAARSRRADRRLQRETNSCQYRCPLWQRSDLICWTWRCSVWSNHHALAEQVHGRTIPKRTPWHCYCYCYCILPFSIPFFRWDASVIGQRPLLEVSRRLRVSRFCPRSPRWAPHSGRFDQRV